MGKFSWRQSWTWARTACALGAAVVGAAAVFVPAAAPIAAKLAIAAGILGGAALPTPGFQPKPKP